MLSSFRKPAICALRPIRAAAEIRASSCVWVSGIFMGPSSLLALCWRQKSAFLRPERASFSFSFSSEGRMDSPLRAMDTHCQRRAPQKVTGSGWGYAVPRGSSRSGRPGTRTLWRGPVCRPVASTATDQRTRSPAGVCSGSRETEVRPVPGLFD